MSKRKTSAEYISEVAIKNPNIQVVEEYVDSNVKILHRCKICNYEWTCSPRSILMGHGCPACGHKKVGKLIKKTQEEYIRKVLSINPYIEVMDEYIDSRTPIKHKCKKCGYEWETSPDNVLRRRGCPVCIGKTIGPAPTYANSIWASEYRELAEHYGISEQQMKTTMPMSKKRVTAKCPNCDKTKDISPNQLFRKGISCNRCSDGISYPEKFIASMLDQLSIHYEMHYCPSWANKRRYDFYLSDCNCIIEVHGEQHYKETNLTKLGGRTLTEEQDNDSFKENIAKQNGIINYFVIDCRESTLDWIKNSLEHNSFMDILNIDVAKIDWNKCNLDALSSKMKQAVDLWNSDKSMTTTKIANCLNVSVGAVLSWLKKASESKLCDYNQKKGLQRAQNEEWIKNLSESHKGQKAWNKGNVASEEYKKICQRVQKCNRIICLETNVIYNSQHEAGRQMGLEQSCISRSVRSNGCHSVKGYHFQLVKSGENDLKGEQQKE
ncbi:MAG: zinc-ribbon domain-containing protein [Candidatus Kurthia intestinigallinarum]